MADQNVSKVKLLRTQQNKTIVALCKETGLGISTLALADQGILSERTAALLANALGVRPQSLLPKPKKS